MVAEVVIAIANTDAVCNSSVQFLEVFFNVRTIVHYEFNYVEIALAK